MGTVSINDAVMALTDDGPRLKGGRCTDCGNHVFPIQSGCPKCAGSSIEPALLGTEGTLWAWTIQGFPPKSPPYLGDTSNFEPYGVGYVALDEELKVEARLTENDPKVLHEGMRMRLTTLKLTEEDGDDVVTFAFEPAES